MNNSNYIPKTKPVGAINQVQDQKEQKQNKRVENEMMATTSRSTGAFNARD